MIYNVYNEVICDYNCDACSVAEDCTDRVYDNNMHKYNHKVIERMTQIFKNYNIEDVKDKDFYSYIASIIYNKPYENCLSNSSEGYKLRMFVKQMLIPIILEYEGLFEE